MLCRNLAIEVLEFSVNLTPFSLIPACDSTESVWLCVSCGILSCGRYVKAHGLRHFEDTHKKHAVCMDTKETAVFW